MNKRLFRNIGVAVTATSCLAVGAWGISAADAGASSQDSRLAPGVLRCYRTHANPNVIICYEVRHKRVHRGGQIVYVPLLVRVPTPSNPPPAILVVTLPPTTPPTTPPPTTTAPTTAPPTTAPTTTAPTTAPTTTPTTTAPTTMPTAQPTMPTAQPTMPTAQPTMPTEQPAMPTEQPAMPTGGGT